MNPELKQAFEQIDNQILRILLYSAASAIVTLSGALAYLWHQWRAEQRERLAMDREATIATTTLAVALQRQTDELADLRSEVADLRNHYPGLKQ